MSGLTSCAECGMPCRMGEYHPYAACLLFKAYANSELVRQNIGAIRRPTPEPQGEAVAYQCRLIDIENGKVVDNWRECSKESYDIDGGSSRDGAYLRTEYRQLYTRPQPGEGGGEVSPDANVESVRAKMLERSRTGLLEYGVTTERGDLSPLEWLTHLQQEMMDGAIYAEVEIRRLSKGGQG